MTMDSDRIHELVQEHVKRKRVAFHQRAVDEGIITAAQADQLNALFVQQLAEQNERDYS